MPLLEVVDAAVCSKLKLWMLFSAHGKKNPTLLLFVVSRLSLNTSHLQTQ